MFTRELADVMTSFCTSQQLGQRRKVIFIILYAVKSASSKIKLKTGDFKAISSPDYPNDVNYPDVVEFRIEIRSPRRSFIELTFLDFDFPCFHANSLFIYNGKFYYTF